MMKPILYLLGGNGSTAAWWDDTLPLFTHYQAQPLELPGFGTHPQAALDSLDRYSDALLAQSQPGNTILAVGANALVVLHAAVKRPLHFQKIFLLAPIGAYLWQRRLPRLMNNFIMRHLAHAMLAYYPKFFRKRFTQHAWSKKIWQRFANGYQHCRAFIPYFKMIQPHIALTLFETIETPVHIFWGEQDNLVCPPHASAWEGILCRAPLQFSFIKHWGHYPYFDNAADFVKNFEHPPHTFIAHSKAGRLQLAQRAGLPVPELQRLTSAADLQYLNMPLHQHYAVRSSSHYEDQKDCANAGLSTSYIRVARHEIAAHVHELLQQGVQEVIVQRFVEPVISGVAFVRHINMDIEWVYGHLSKLVDGHVQPQRIRYSAYGEPWGNSAKTHADFPLSQLLELLQNTLRAFHYQHLDIEWGWDGTQFHLFQARPVTHYPWRRFLTAANVGELLKTQPSYISHKIMQGGAYSDNQIFALWDTRVLKDAEPFMDTYGDAGYINADSLLIQLYRYGLPSSILEKEVGGGYPIIRFNLWRFIRSIPVLLRVLLNSRARLSDASVGIAQLDRDLDRILTLSVPDERTLQQWANRLHVFLLQANIIINSAVTSSIGQWFYRSRNCYQTIDKHTSPHRIPYESDLASPRLTAPRRDYTPMPQLQGIRYVLFRLGLPGFRGYCSDIREWFRDNHTRLLHRLHWYVVHHAGLRSKWFADWPYPRDHAGGFWKNEGTALSQTHAFILYPGHVQGIVGEDILIVNTLEPGQYDRYRQAKAIIARSGGLLSHGATLVRELKVPSAINPDVTELTYGTLANYADGQVTVITRPFAIPDNSLSVNPDESPTRTIQ